ncbi:bifunctional ADP-dependent NAD(P)H-hydrate dehydratase/NAD(P)H-hydrate epimerase [Cellulomonas sp. SLBN-39]|uniref:bifunctional ADP-dependent NAD(P)H-hydrate dehydratase/NAD(P)H-hydrate epimerase n=1 Tax=Cellulomonas sp. SLBN-39 TaxID=2768446 RepID=UPI001152479E|nr:bifunctional ADP-dependent NAD(P)H-hydrate dehydratase/NAD(P)H-hydrate epimerase [Cellulomonas sp. SLBN-39]TQL03412.1 hydroxyethylthiazole kinase-like uncharacterized protein yjeF/hydroxyethylthiazole kinase-like uncharacterized protein yjeF [Cellulomonas sp. SLBN-39]
MLLTWDAAAVRAAEEPLLRDGVPLMTRAATGLAHHVARLLRRARGAVRGAHVVLLVGGGNNGGDTLHAGALLARRGVRVTALTTVADPHAEGLAAVRTAGGRVLPVPDGDLPAPVRDALGAADVVLDGLLGLGARGGGVRGPGAGLVAALADLRGHAGPGPLVVAVDLPSGVGVDDGTCAGPVPVADVTVTFGVPQPAHVLPPAAAAVGHLVVVDIGLDLAGPPAVARLEAADVVDLWPVPPASGHKYVRGVVGVVAGSAAYPGAAVLATSGALRAGVGMVRYLGDAPVVAAHPEVVAGPGRVQAWVVGPGVGPDDDVQRSRARDAVARAASHGEPVVVDAGALDVLPPRVPPHVVLTPHAGELATLLTARGAAVSRADVEASPWEHARRAHEVTGATVLLKGPVTVVVGPHGAAYAQADGPPWLATAGAGDVLAGVLGAVLAGRAADAAADPTLPAALAALAALVHGRAAHAANPGGPVTASAVADAVPATVAALLGGAAR